MKKLFWGFLTSALFTSMGSLAQQPLTAAEKWDLRKCVDYALENNISVKQQEIQAKIAQLTYKQSNLSKFPNLNFSSNAGVNTGRSIDPTTNQFTTQSTFFNSFSLQSNVNVFNWFNVKNTIAGNNFQAQSASASVDKLKNDISLNVAAAYLQALLAKEQVKASQLQINLTSAQLENTKKLVLAGSLPELNQLQLESQLATDSFTLISAIGTETQSLLLIKSLLNLDAGKPFDVDTPPIELIPVDPVAELQPEMVYDLALKNLPQQRVNQLKLLAAQKYADASKGAMYPTIGIGGSLGTNYSDSKNNANRYYVPGVDTIAHVFSNNDAVVIPKTGATYFSDPFGTQFSDNFNSRIGISLSVPIFNGRSARTNWEKQKLNVQNLTLQQDLDNMSLKQDIYKAYTDAMTAMQKYNASSRAVITAQKTYDFSEKRYNIGLLSTIDLITSQNNLFKASIDKLSAQYDYVFKMKVLEFYKGQGIKL
jgi:outer membrane protein